MHALDEWQFRPQTVGALISCMLLVACEGRLANRRDQALQQTYELNEETREVRVEIVQGDLTFIKGEPGVVVVRGEVRRAADTTEQLAALEAVEVAPEVDKGTHGVLALKCPAVPEHLDIVSHRIIYKVVVEVPPGTSVVGNTGFGHMAAMDLVGVVTLKTGHGDMRLDSCLGDATIQTGGGAVLVQGHRGGLNAESGKCQTMQVFIDELGESGVRLATKKGGVQAHLPANSAFVLDAKTQCGRARNGYEIAVERLPETEQGRSMRGDVGGGGPLVQLDAEVGNISVRSRTEQ